MEKITVKFHKALHKLTNSTKQVELYSNSYIDIVTSCMSLFPELDKFIKKYATGNNKECQELFFIVDNKVLPIEKSFIAPSTDKEIILCPTIKGSGDNATLIILGIALIIVSVIIPGSGVIGAGLTVPSAGGAIALVPVATTGFAALAAGGSLTALASIGVGLGFVLLLSGLSMPVKLSRPESTDDASRINNDSFGALGNTIGQRNSVALNYGDVRVAGHFISGGVVTVSHALNEIIKVGNFFD